MSRLAGLGLKPNKIRIGITGGIGTGKSTVTAYLRSKGYPVIDADALAHALSDADEAYIRAVSQAFGPEVLRPEGGIDRELLGKIIFNDPQKRDQLNAIAHPRIYQAMEEAVNQAFERSDIVFQDIPLLYESADPRDFDAVWLVYAPAHVQIRRLMDRDGLDLDAAQARIRSQMSIEEKRELADVLLVNTGSVQELEGQIDRQLERIS